MNFPRLSARRWFWMLVIAAGLWALLATYLERKENARIASDNRIVAPGAPLIMRRVENLFRTPFDALLTPARFVPNYVQTLLNGIVERAIAIREPGETVEQLRDKISALENENTYLTGQAQRLQADYDAISHLKNAFGISARDVLPANITGRQAGMNTSIIVLDKGSRDGIRPGMVVLSSLSPLGRVETVGWPTCEVRLITDPTAKTRAVIIRKTRERNTMVLVPDCLITGLGNGQLRCETVREIDVALPPEKGDLVLLKDSYWPLRVQSAVLGEVTEVGRKEAQYGRYDIRVTPRVSINSISSAVVLLQD